MGSPSEENGFLFHEAAKASSLHNCNIHVLSDMEEIDSLAGPKKYFDRLIITHEVEQFPLFPLQDHPS